MKGIEGFEEVVVPSITSLISNQLGHLWKDRLKNLIGVMTEKDY
jgi:hypothetical protein